MRIALLFIAIGVAAMAAETGKKVYACTPVQPETKTQKGGIIGILTIDGVAQPGYCTSSTSKGWSTEAMAVRPNVRPTLSNSAFINGDQVCTIRPGKPPVVIPPGSPGPTIPCEPPMAFATSLPVFTNGAMQVMRP